MVKPKTSKPVSKKLRVAQCEEAIKRLRILEERGLNPSYRELFERDSTIIVADVHPTASCICGAYGPMGDNSPEPLLGKSLMDHVSAIEEDLGVLVYSAAHMHFHYGSIFSLLVVGKDTQEWDRERQLLLEHKAMSLLCYCSPSGEWLIAPDALDFQLVEGALIP